MNSLFKRLSPTLQTWILDHGALLFFVPLMVVLVILFLVFWRFEPHHHVGFVPAEVLVTHDLTSEMDYLVRGIVRLPDGTEASVSANSFAKAQWFALDACVEVRQKTETGGKLYKLAAPSNCGD